MIASFTLATSPWTEYTCQCLPLFPYNNTTLLLISAMVGNILEKRLQDFVSYSFNYVSACMYMHSHIYVYKTEVYMHVCVCVFM